MDVDVLAVMDRNANRLALHSSGEAAAEQRAACVVVKDLIAAGNKWVAAAIESDNGIDAEEKAALDQMIAALARCTTPRIQPTQGAGGCGACGDACADRSDCFVNEESP